MRRIESVNNEYIKELSKLKQKKYRDIEKKFLVEGYHLVKEAKENLISVLVVNEEDMVEGVNNYLVTDAIIKKLSTSVSPQPIIGVCRTFCNDSLYKEKILLLDDLQDPGNIGTIIRSSLGFGIDTIVLSENSVDLYNEKLIRASQGAIFKTNIIQKDLSLAIKEIKNKNIKVFGTSLKNGKPLNKIPKVSKYCLILGNEGNGVRSEILKNTDENIFIEISEKIESLNVAIAGAIIMHYFYCD